MSLFGSFMGDFDEDPFFGSHMRHMRHMNAMIDQMFSGNPFGGLLGMGPPALTAPTPMRNDQQLMPFGGFPALNMNRMFHGLDDLSNNPNCHSYSSSTVMTMSSGPDGRPQVYQASSSTRTGPGGVKETKKSVSDSRLGIKKMAIGHHIGERAHVLEREHNLHSGDQEEHQEFINLEEDEAEEFNQEFEQKARYTQGNAITYSPQHPQSSGRRSRDAPQLALPGYSRRNRHNQNGRHKHGKARGRTSADTRPRSRSSIHRTHPALTSSSRPRQSVPPQQTQTSRKRDHEPDIERKHKSLKPSPHQSSPK